jgi:type IV pilus assembly protein PilA
MSEKSDLLSKIKPLTDPLRILAALGVINAVVLTIVGVATGRLSSFGLACLSLGLGLLIAPSGKPNAIYLRAFRTDKSTAELRAKIAAILGSDFRLSGIRPPRKRTSVFMRFLSPNFFALSFAAMVAAVAALLLSSSLGALRSLSLNDDAELITILVLAAVVVGFFLVLLIRGIFRVGVRARRLEHAGHRDAARRAWFLLLLEILLFLATPVLTAVEPIQKLLASKKKANEASAVAVLRTLNTVELTYSVTYPDIGYACQLSTLGGNADSGGPRPEAAQLISADLASGQRSGYTFLISNCRTSLVNGRNVYTGYRITAVPTTVSQSGDRGFCTDEGMEIHYDPNGGTNCTEPLQ